MDGQFEHRPGIPLGTWLLIGAAGAGMRSLAEALNDCEVLVRGIDLRFSGRTAVQQFEEESGTFPGQLFLHSMGFRAPDLQQLFEGVCQVVVSPAVPADDPCVVYARRCGLPVYSLVEALQRITDGSHRLCVAGTHGKSTTTAMTWSILAKAQQKFDAQAPVRRLLRSRPALFCGAQLIGINRTGIGAGGPVAVLESCEYRCSFLRLSPATVVLTGIERDHFDCFPGEHDEDRAFSQFLSRLPPQGTVIVNGESRRAMKVALASGRRILTAGWTADCDVRGRVLSRESGQLRIAVCQGGTHLGDFCLPVPGNHNATNALLATAAGLSLGVSFEHIAAGVESFQGLRRRFERLGTLRGIDWVDDYAHHPDAVRVTLETAREVFPDRKIIVIFEPHQLSRARMLHSEFLRALGRADECWLLPVLPARESGNFRDCCRESGKLVDSLNQEGRRAFLLANLDQVVGRIDHSARPGDVIITMGAGRTNQIHGEYHRRLFRDSAA